MKRYGYSYLVIFISFMITATLIAYAMASYYLSVDPEETSEATKHLFESIIILVISLGMALLLLGNIARCILWHASGYDGTPLILPFIIIDTVGFKFTYDISLLAEFIFPKTLYEAMNADYDEELLKTKTISVEKTRCIIIYIMLIAIGVFAFATKRPELFFSTLIVLAFFINYGLLNSRCVHGALVKLHYIREGYVLYYFMYYMAGTGKYPNICKKYAEKEINEYGKENYYLRNQSIIAWQNVFVTGCETDLGLEAYHLAFVKDKWLGTFEINEFFISAERLVLMKIFLCWAINNIKDEERLYVADSFLHMSNEYEGDNGRSVNNKLCRLAEIANFRCPADAKEIDLIRILGGVAAFRHGKAVIKSANKRARYIYCKITEMRK